MKDIEQQFAGDIANHVMTVIREDGVYRHLRFAQPGTSAYHFELVTWPGYLAYTGDMGAFVFTRTHDMLEFFRRPEHCRYSIDMRYWAEKAVTTNKTYRGDGIHEWSPDKFRRAVNEQRVQWIRDAREYGSLNKEQRRELWEAVGDEILRQIESGREFAEMAVYNFSWQAGANHPTYQFEDFWDHDLQQYTHTFQWCCLALNWAVQVYDKAKEAV